MALNLNKSTSWNVGCWLHVIAFILFVFGIAKDSFAPIFWSVLISAIAIILSIIGFISRSVDAVIEFVYNGFLDLFGLRNEIKQRCPQAMKAKILAKKKDAVNVGIFGNSSNQIQTMNIHSNQGISNDLYVGQEIPLYN